MKQFSTISTLIFDFGGVLINLDLNQCILNLKKLGLENVEQYLSNFGQKDFFLKYEKGLIDTAQFRDEIRKLTPRSLTDAEIDAAWCSFLCDIPTEKLDLLLELRKKYRILMLSNTNPLHIEVSADREFEKVGTKRTDYFDTCYLSYEMKMAKPDAEIFQAILDHEKIQPSECLFLDDGQKNIQRADEMGFQTYLVSDNEDLSFLLKL